MPKPILTSWSVAKHDTIPQVDFSINPLEGHAYLRAFLDSEHETHAPPYQPIRDSIARVIAEAAARKRKGQAPSADVEDQRIRTWKSTFESMGFLIVDTASDQYQLTSLGRAVRDLYDNLNDKIEGANDRLAQLAVGMLFRHRLRNPLSGQDYPEDSDVRPYQFMFRAMRLLDNRIHWQEMNRVLMHVLYRKDEDAAIQKIGLIRQQTAGVYDDANVALLGTPCVDDGNETKRRITPWFSQASFGGLLIAADDDVLGFRCLAETYKPLVDEAVKIDDPVPPEAALSPEAYLRFVTQIDQKPAEIPSATDTADVSRVVEAAKRYGTRKVIALTGIPSTGKTRLAKMAAMHLVEGDPYRFEEIQFHPSTAYEDFMEGFVPKPNGEGHELMPKVFRVINRRAQLDPNGATYVLLIEEFTRADVHSVLGELLTYVEHRDRPFRLAISGQLERVAPNLVIMTTMNPRDKTALTLDDAITRRLHREPIASSVERLGLILDGKLEASLLAQLKKWVEKFLPILPFGHGEFAFMRTEHDLRDAWNGTIIYFFLDALGAVREVYKSAVEEYPWK